MSRIEAQMGFRFVEEMPEDPGQPGKLNTPKKAFHFALAGNATLTVVSLKTGTRFTYKIQAPTDSEPGNNPIWFVKGLTGADNESDFTYLGQIRNGYRYDHGRKSKVKGTAPIVVAFAWFWNVVVGERPGDFSKVDVWHEGRCGRCGRKLTVPESVYYGFGPECRKYKGIIPESRP